MKFGSTFGRPSALACHAIQGNAVEQRVGQMSEIDAS